MIQYNDLDKHFAAPKKLSPFFNCNRVPRKFKKKWKHILYSDRYNYMDLNQKLWYIMEFTNLDYKRFLIKKIIENDKSK